VVNAAYFSPTGHKILTTCQDNRLRVWENAAAVKETPDKEIVHSHDFNRCDLLVLLALFNVLPAIAA
jgi:DNA damage-binding protein 2